MTYTEEWERWRHYIYYTYTHPSLSCDIHIETQQRERERVWWAEEDSGGRWKKWVINVRSLISQWLSLFLRFSHFLFACCFSLIDQPIWFGSAKLLIVACFDCFLEIHRERIERLYHFFFHSISYSFPSVIHSKWKEVWQWIKCCQNMCNLWSYMWELLLSNSFS